MRHCIAILPFLMLLLTPVVCPAEAPKPDNPDPKGPISALAVAIPLRQTHELKPSGAIPAVVNCVSELAFAVGQKQPETRRPPNLVLVFADDQY